MTFLLRQEIDEEGGHTTNCSIVPWLRSFAQHLPAKRQSEAELTVQTTGCMMPAI